MFKSRGESNKLEKEINFSNKSKEFSSHISLEGKSNDSQFIDFKKEKISKVGDRVKIIFNESFKIGPINSV